MKEQSHCTPGASPGATAKGETVSIYVDHNHSLLQLKRALPWEALCEVMTRHWRRAGKKGVGKESCSCATHMSTLLCQPPSRNSSTTRSSADSTRRPW